MFTWPTNIKKNKDVNIFSSFFLLINMASSSTISTDFEHFGTKLFSQISRQNDGKNIFFSPASIALAMSMCTIGSRHETLQQMLRVLEVSSIEQLTKTSEQIMRLFTSVDQDKQVQLKLANRLYAQKAYKIQQDYLNLIQKSFQSDLKLEDFENESTKIVQTINTWVENQTNKLIQNLLSSEDITQNTRLVIVNCIYFKGTWVKQFEEYLTNQQADFYELNGTITKIKLMHQQESFLYSENKDLKIQIAHLPYKSDDYNTQLVFTVILPNRGVRFEEVERKLISNPQLMKQILSVQDTTSKKLLLYLPKFKMETTFQLNDVLIQLGMQNAFSGPSADFTGIVKKEDMQNNLYISRVIHKAFIDVNEIGENMFQ